MQTRLKRMDVGSGQSKILKNRTLAQFGYDFARLIYLSSFERLQYGESIIMMALAHSFFGVRGQCGTYNLSPASVL